MLGLIFASQISAPQAENIAACLLPCYIQCKQIFIKFTGKERFPLAAVSLQCLGFAAISKPAGRPFSPSLCL